MSFNITPVASGYQEIHPYSAMTIDSVKINTSLIMMKEWKVSNEVKYLDQNSIGKYVQRPSNDNCELLLVQSDQSA
jgi:hypothetical protein